MATNSSILAWRIPLDRAAWCATVHGNWFQTQEGKFIQWPPKTPTLSTQYKNFSCPLSGHGWCLCLTLVVKNVSPNSQLEGLLLRMLFLKFLKTL